MNTAAGAPHGQDGTAIDPATRSRPGDLRKVNPPFRVAALVVPTLTPAWLARYSWGSMTTGTGFNEAWAYTEGVHEISLFFGRMDAPSGPAVTVATTIIDDQHHQLRTLESELAGELHRLTSSPAGTASTPGRPAGAVSLPIGAVSFPVELCCEDQLWGARAGLELPDQEAKGTRLVVTVVARGIPFASAALDWVDDLRPFVAERRRMIDAVRNEARSPRRSV